MKTKLMFEFGEDDDANMAKVYTNALTMYFTLTELKDRLRSIVKYDEGNYEKLNGIEAIEKFRDEFFELVATNGVDLDTLS